MSKQAMTIRQACVAFGISAMNLSHWRKGTATKEALPSETDGRAVSIPVVSARKWAKAHGVEFVVDPDKAIADEANAPGAAGPKVKKATPAKKAAAKKAPAKMARAAKQVEAQAAA